MGGLGSIWLRIQLRQAFRRYSQRWSISEAWLASANLVAIAVLSAAFSFHYLKGWQGSPLLPHYLHWYLLVAWVALALNAAANFLYLLWLGPECVLIHTSPLSRRKLSTACFVYSLFTNLILFAAVTQPPLVVSGWLLGARPSFFALLPAVLAASVLTSTALGAVLALVGGWLAQLLPRSRGKFLFGFLSPLGIPSSYIVLTWVLPWLFPPFPPPRGTVLIPSLAAELLVAAAHGEALPGTAGGLLAGLTLFLAMACYSLGRLAPIYPIQPSTAPKGAAPRPRRFRPLPVLLGEVRAGWRRAALVGAGVGLTGTFLLKPGPTAPPLALLFSLLWLWYLILFLMVAARSRAWPGLLRHEAGFFLARASPSCLFRIVGQAVVGFLVHAIGGMVVTTVVYTAFAARAGIHWGEALVSLLVLLPCLAVPPVVIGQAVEFLFFRPAREPPFGAFWRSIPLDITPPLAFVGFLGAGWVFLFPYPRVLPPGELAWRAAVFFAISLGAVYLLLRLASWRLQRIEWR